MIDLQLPEPLLHPGAWPTQSHDLLVSIAHVVMGGPIDALWARAEKLQKTLSIAIPANFWTSAVMREPSLKVLVQSRFESLKMPAALISREVLSRAEQDSWKKLWLDIKQTHKLTFEVQKTLREVTLVDWSREVFPESFRDAGEIVWRREFQSYQNEIAAGFVSIDQLRFWPGFLRLKKLSFANTAAAEWSYAQALFSPQDDRQSAGPVALLNQTLQIFESEKTLNAIWRVDGQIKKRKLAWDEAAAIDELRESPRMTCLQLEAELQANSYPFKDVPDFGATLARLTDDGLILRRS